MRPIVVTVGGLGAADADGISLSQTPTSGTALTIDGAFASGGVATLDQPRRVLLTHGNEGSARTLVVTGTDWAGNTISETLSVPSGGASTVATVLDYKTVTSLLPAGGGWTAAVTVGTNGVAGSAWVRLDEWTLPPTSIQVVVTGTINYTVQQTLDDPNSITDPVARASVTWFSHPDSGLVAATASAQGSYINIPAWCRIVANSGTGTARMTVVQTGSPE